MDEAAQLIQLHSTMVGTAQDSESKRQSVSVVSIGLLSAGIGLFAADNGFDALYLVPSILIISAIWFVTVRYYQKLAKAKWDVIADIETRLCFQPFTEEWRLYNTDKSNLTFGPSTLEQVVPALIILATSFYSLYRIISYFC